MTRKKILDVLLVILFLMGLVWGPLHLIHRIKENSRAIKAFDTDTIKRIEKEEKSILIKRTL